MRIKLLKPYGMSVAGAILENVNKPVATLLIQRKIAKALRKKKKNED